MVDKFQCKNCGTFASESSYLLAGNRCPNCDSVIDEIKQKIKNSFRSE